MTTDTTPTHSTVTQADKDEFKRLVADDPGHYGDPVWNVGYQLVAQARQAPAPADGPQCNMALRSAVFEALRQHDVDEDCFAAVASITHAALSSPAPEAVERYRHKKRGTEYDLICVAELQDAAGNGLREGEQLCIYRGDDGCHWAREASEFVDGRFERLSRQPKETE